MKRTLESLVFALALSSAGCVTTNTPNNTLPILVSGQTADGKYDSLDNYVDVAAIPGLKDANYLIMSESKYKTPDGKEIILHSLGTAVLYKDVGDKTYLVTANHVVKNEDVLRDFFGKEYKKLSEKFFLLDDSQADRLQDLLRKSSETQESGKFYFEDSSGKKRELKNIVRTSEDIAIAVKIIKPREVKTSAYNEADDVAIISVPKLAHQPLVYALGNSDELQTQNLVYVVGWPLGLVKNVTQGHVTSVNDSLLVRSDPQANFIFDASISPGNSGGAIFAVRDGKFELIGITDATYTGANDLYIGVKINSIKDVFKGDSIRCSDGWKCNLSLPYELKL